MSCVTYRGLIWVPSSFLWDFSRELEAWVRKGELTLLWIVGTTNPWAGLESNVKPLGLGPRFTFCCPVFANRICPGYRTPAWPSPVHSWLVCCICHVGGLELMGRSWGCKATGPASGDGCGESRVCPWATSGKSSRREVREVGRVYLAVVTVLSGFRGSL